MGLRRLRAERAGVRGFAVIEQDGAWGTAVPLPGLAAANAGGFARVDSLSCLGSGTCTAVGYFTDRSGDHQEFLTQTG